AQEIRVRDARQPIPYAVLGDLARSRGHLEEAQKMYAYATQLDPGNTRYARGYEDLLRTAGRRGIEGSAGTKENVALPAVGIGGLMILMMALYVALNPEVPLFPAVPILSTLTLGAMVMLFLSGVVLG
ncbi:MAG: hypothetical protein C4320_02765, partial [Armatimonadota bacterium]